MEDRETDRSLNNKMLFMVVHAGYEGDGRKNAFSGKVWSIRQIPSKFMYQYA